MSVVFDLEGVTEPSLGFSSIDHQAAFCQCKFVWIVEGRDEVDLVESEMGYFSARGLGYLITHRQML